MQLAFIEGDCENYTNSHASNAGKLPEASFQEYEAVSDDDIDALIDEMKPLRACLKSAVCRVRTAHRPLLAPEGRKVCRNAETPYT